MVYGRTLSLLLLNLVAALGSMSCFSAVPVSGQSVSLGWSASPSITVAGYHLYYGGASHVYTNLIDTGSSTRATVPGLRPGATYYFAVTAYDLAGLESAFSDEIYYAVSAAAKLAVLITSGQTLVTGRGPAGYTYEVQTSPDLQNWSTVGNVTMDGNGKFLFLDPDAAKHATGYYRLRQTSP